MTDPLDPTRQLLADRYGQPGRHSRLLVIVLVILLAAAALSWLVWAAWVHSTPDVNGKLRSYTVVSEHRVHVVIEATRTSAVAVECRVTARSSDHAVVGEETVTIPSGDAGRVTFEADISTDRTATTATVTDCH